MKLLNGQNDRSGRPSVKPRKRTNQKTFFFTYKLH